MSNEADITEVVDELTDELDPIRIENEAERLGITAEELLHRITKETLSRLGD